MFECVDIILRERNLLILSEFIERQELKMRGFLVFYYPPHKSHCRIVLLTVASPSSLNGNPLKTSFLRLQGDLEIRIRRDVDGTLLISHTADNHLLSRILRQSEISLSIAADVHLNILQIDVGIGDPQSIILICYLARSLRPDRNKGNG